MSRQLLAFGLMLAAASGCSRSPDPTPWTSTAVRGHHDARKADDGTLTPLFASTIDPAALCLSAQPEVDTSQWLGRLWWDRDSPGAAIEPVARMAGTVCFAMDLTAAPAGEPLEICGEVRDAYDGRIWQLPCTEVFILADDTAYAELRQRLTAVLLTADGTSLQQLEQSLEALAVEARHEDFPLLGLRLELIAAYFQRTLGDAADRGRAIEQLAAAAVGLDQPAAAAWIAQLEQTLHDLELANESPDWPSMWTHLRRAADLFLLTADHRRFTATTQQANLLANAGATQRATETMRTALAECVETPCPGPLLAAARGALAWFLITDPLANIQDWAEAEAILDELLEPGGSQVDAFTRANRLLNRAYLHNRQSRPATGDFEEARRLLARDPSSRDEALIGWADLLAGEAQLSDDAQAALTNCQRALKAASSPLLAAWAAGCVAESYRRLGSLEMAAASYENALRLHENAAPARLDQDLPIDLGRRADDFYRAARVALEIDRADDAWELLERLDALSAGRRVRCDASGAQQPILASQRARRQRDLSSQLDALARPASLAREQQLISLRRLLRDELGELIRRRPCSNSAPDSSLSKFAGHRAITLEDEIILLARSPQGEVTLVRTTDIARTVVTGIARRLSSLMTAGASDDEWRALAAPLSRALVPDHTSSGFTGYWLHGSLQNIPLAALPLAGETPGAPRWLGEMVTPVLYPAALGPDGRNDFADDGASAWTFVVDPVSNLASGRRLARFYRRSFPAARVLAGRQATTAAISQGMRSSSWLHVDAHGVYDPAFPELSHLALADGALRMTDLAALAPRLRGANLLGCWTGAWPVTADSGRYGLAGALTRAGVRWTIASRTAITDLAGAEFNRIFYSRLRSGETVVAAYAEAMSMLRGKVPASQWAALMLLGRPQSNIVTGDTVTGNTVAQRLLTKRGT